MEFEYKSIIEIDRNIAAEELKEITRIIEAAFVNRAGTVKNTSKDPYVFIFEGNEPEWNCLGLGDSSVRDNPAMKGKISSWRWIEKNPEECADLLALYRRYGYRI